MISSEHLERQYSANGFAVFGSPHGDTMWHLLLRNLRDGSARELLFSKDEFMDASSHVLPGGPPRVRAIGFYPVEATAQATMLEAMASWKADLSQATGS